MKRNIFGYCFECGRLILENEPFYNVSLSREKPMLQNNEWITYAKYYRALAYYCISCGQGKKFDEIMILQKKKMGIERQLQKIIHQKSSPLAVIRIQDEIRGTGVFISKNGILLTAGHVIEDIIKEWQELDSKISEEIGRGLIKKKNRESIFQKRWKSLQDKFDIEVGPLRFGCKYFYFFPAWIIDYSSESDIAVLQVASESDFKFIDLAPDYSPSLGEEVYGIACTPRLSCITPNWSATVFATKITGIEKCEISTHGIICCQIDYKIERGNSGGAILNHDGKIVGVISGHIPSEVLLEKKDTGLIITGGKGLFYTLASSGIDFEEYIKR